MSEGRLLGSRVLVTRPKERAEELCFLLEDEGAEVLSLPMLELQPPDDPRPLRAAAEGLHRYGWVLFASPSAVEALVEAAREAGTLDVLAQRKVGAVGEKTLSVAQALGMSVRLSAPKEGGAGLARAIEGKIAEGEEVLLPAAQEGRRELFDALLAMGARPALVAAYKAVASSVDPALVSQLGQRAPDVVLFSSPRSADAFFDAFGGMAEPVVAAARVVAIGPTTAAALLERGVKVAAVAERPSAAAFVEAAVSAFAQPR